MSLYLYRVHSVLYPSLSSSLDGISADVFLKGCTRHCKGCHNYELQHFSEPDTPVSQVIDAINTYGSECKVISIMGGEPLEQEHLYEFIAQLKLHTNKKIALFTGFNLGNVPSNIRNQVDYIKTGDFQENNRTSVGSFLASKNQVMWKKINNEWTIQWEYEEDV